MLSFLVLLNKTQHFFWTCLLTVLLLLPNFSFVISKPFSFRPQQVFSLFLLFLMNLECLPQSILLINNDRSPRVKFHLLFCMRSRDLKYLLSSFRIVNKFKYNKNFVSHQRMWIAVSICLYNITDPLISSLTKGFSNPYQLLRSRIS